MPIELEAIASLHGQHLIRVTVRYAAAIRPFKEEASRDETLAAVKAHALNAFGLQEGPLPDGNIATYKLFHGKEELTDLSRTVGGLAGHSQELELKLSQHLTQGGW